MKRSKRSLKVRMRHEDDYGMNEDTNLSQAVCVHLTRKTVKGQRH